ncbi:MAG: hypothetical protein LBC83_02405 [Oscillospiraceae bacterium]|jgi:hypothetical protein|nr:hypothetical protein [Oscillospiraceae bacterium]
MRKPIKQPRFLRWEPLFYLSFFVFLMLLTCYFPPAPDDRLWTGSYGEELFLRGFANYNGRYLGNLCAYVLLRVPWILPLVKASAHTGILWLTQRFAGNRDRRFLLLSAILLLLPGPLLIQDFAWTTAFLNYEMPVLLLLTVAFLVYKARRRAAWFVVIAILGFATQLFMEHYSLFALAVSGCTALHPKCKAYRARALVWLCSAAAGAALMFSNANYLRVLRGEKGYQRVAPGLLPGFLRALAGFAAACAPVLLLIAILLLLLRRRNPAAWVRLPRSRLLWLCIALLAALNAPLLFVFPMGPRCFSLTAVLLLLMAHRLFTFAARKSTPLPTRPRGARSLTVALAAIMAIDLAGYMFIHAANLAKVAEVRAQVAQGNRTIVLRHTPMRFLVNALDQEPNNRNILRGFLEYYGLPEDVTIHYE